MYLSLSFPNNVKGKHCHELCEISRLPLVKISVMSLLSQPQQTWKLQEIDNGAPKPSYEICEIPRPISENFNNAIRVSRSGH